MRKRGPIGQSIDFVGFVVYGIAHFFHDQWRQFTPMGQALFAIAVLMVGVDAVISFKFGWTQTGAHAIGFAGLAVALFLLPDAAITEWRKGNRAGSAGLGLACLPLAVVCLWTHVGYSSGVRLGDIQQDGFKNAAHASASTTIADKRKTLEMLRGQLATAQEKSKAAAAKNQGWVVSVDPVAMQSQLDAMDTKIKNEAARVKCAQRCEDLKVARGQLAAAISLATEENGITKRIQELEVEIDAKAKEVAASTPPTSTTVSQVKMAAKLVNVVAYYSGMASEDAVLNPSAFQQDMANTAAAGASSLAFLLVGTTLMMGAGMNRKPEFMGKQHSPEPGASVPVSEVGNRTPDARAYPSQLALRTTTIAALRQMQAA